MRKIITTIFLLSIFLFPLTTDARQGCCSHHGGVCGCRCCDGTSLSATCAPYYPSCNEPKPVYTPTQNLPAVEKTPSVNTYNSYMPPKINYSIPQTKEQKDEFDIYKFLSKYWWVIGLGILMLIGWIKDAIDKKKK